MGGLIARGRRTPSPPPAHRQRQVMRLLYAGNTRRTQEATAANATSSRSHAILEIVVRQSSRLPGVSRTVQTGRLFMCDLAGSERAAHTKNTGMRMVEGSHINRSLLALGNCINALCGASRVSYVNYRDSKLTRLLKESLSGNCKTVMIAHISPSEIHFEETYNTLNYANRAKNIKTTVVKNTHNVDAHITEVRA
jgi:kinesin family member 18/19